MSRGHTYLNARFCRGFFLSNEFGLLTRFYEARPAGFEPATRGLEVRCSVLLSYGRNEQKCCKAAHFMGDSNTPRCLMAAVGQQ